MTLHKEGFSTIAITIVTFIVINVVSHYLFGSGLAFDIVLGVSAILLFLVTNFFRCPKRHPVTVEGSIVCPADGKVVVMEEVYEPELLKCNVLQLSIFMSPTNVHINWFPIGGIVRYVRHHSGRFQKAYLPKSSIENERSSVLIQRENGTQILVRQVAGAMARRIVCYAEEEAKVKQASQMGFIKFGSRVDLYLPLDTEIVVKIGDKVRGSQTILGWFNDKKENTHTH